jgi:hypothetical protein
MLGNSVAERLVASQRRLSSMELQNDDHNNNNNNNNNNCPLGMAK